jgi:hypothetical protein
MYIYRRKGRDPIPSPGTDSEDDNDMYVSICLIVI